MTSWPAASTGGTSFAILGRHRHAMAVVVSKRAHFVEAGVPKATAQYLFPGVKVVLLGHGSPTGSTFTATTVRIAPDPARELPGIVVQKPGVPGSNGVAVFRIRNGHKVYTVYTDPGTTYGEKAVHRPGLGDVRAGERVVVLGPRGWPRTTIYASRVTIRNPRLFTAG